MPRARAFDMHPRCQLVAIADTDRANLELAAGRFGVPGYSSWDEMLAHPALDIGVAVLPVRSNAAADVALARAGVRSSFCEKPLTGSQADADRMVDETAARGIPLVCGVVVSSTSDYQRAYRLVAEGEIGDEVAFPSVIEWPGVVAIEAQETRSRIGQAAARAGEIDDRLSVNAAGPTTGTVRSCG